MSTRSLLVLSVVLVLGMFDAANWAAFTMPTTLPLLVATVQAPLGIVMLGVSVAVAGMFLIYAFYLHTSARREASARGRTISSGSGVLPCETSPS